MRAWHMRIFIVGILFSALSAVSAADDKAEAVTKDRERILGTWRVVSLVINGERARDEDAQKLSVVNGIDGSWSLNMEGREIAGGTSTIDPIRTPKTIDFTVTTGDSQGDRLLGIYELGEKTRKLCVVQKDRERPTDFTSTPGSERILVIFEREPDE